MRTEPHDDLQRAIDENLRISKQVLEAAQSTRRAMRWMAFGGWIRTLLWLVPIVAAAIFLPPLISKLKTQYESLLGPQGIGGIKVQLEGLQDASEQGKAIINKVIR